MQRFVFFLSFSLALIASANAATLSGTVLDPNGKPIAGATVVLSVFTRMDNEKPATAVSDLKGAWKFELEPLDVKKPDEIGALVMMHAPGFALSQFLAKNKDNKLQLQKGTRARGVVVDAAGKPLANIPVRLVSVIDRKPNWRLLDYLLVQKPLESVFSTRTGKDGRWMLADLPSTGEAYFEVSDPKYNLVNAKAKLGTEEASVDKITLRLGAVLTGRVVDESGHPVANAHVSAGMRDGRNGS